VALGSHAAHPITINAPRGSDETRGSTGFSATELLLAGAGACAAWDVVEILRKRRTQIADLNVTVEADQQPEPPWTYTRVALHFQVTGERLSVPVLARVIRLSIVRYCSVISTIAVAAAIEATIELVGESGASSGRHLIELAIPASTIASADLAALGVSDPDADEESPRTTADG
jgi:putative redox protein